MAKWLNDLPSGERLHNHGKSACLMGKSTNLITIFNSNVTDYQRVNRSVNHHEAS